MNIVMLVGNTGVGKSSLGCRLLGHLPWQAIARPFEVAASASGVTQLVQQAEGTWLGQGQHKLRVVDSPGLGDSRGPVVDTENMASIGKYLNIEPVNAVLFVFGYNPRIDYTLKRLISIVITKVHPSDYNKLAIVINCYEHNDVARRKRQIQSNGQDEAQSQETKRQLVVKALEGYAKQSTLKLSTHQIESFHSRIFFLDSQYFDSTADETAFVDLQDWCLSNEVINKEKIAQDTGDVYVELSAVNAKLKGLESEAAASQHKHQKEVKAIQARLDKERADAQYKQKLADAVAKERQQALEKEMQEKGEAHAARLKEEKRRNQEQEEARRRAHEQELHRLEERAREALEHQRVVAEKEQAIREEKKKVAEERKQRLAAEETCERLRRERDEQGCFPGNSMVEVQGKGSVLIQELEAGDKVVSVNTSGARIYDEVIFFGHRESKTWTQYQILTVQQADAGIIYQLHLTPNHFLPVGPEFASANYKYAAHVTIGQTVWVLSEGAPELQPAVVIKSHLALEQGIFNPFTKGGMIVVDGVVASTHSHWLLDDIVPAVALSWLPCLYQMTYAPVFMMARMFGVPAFSNFLDKHVVPYCHALPASKLLKRLRSYGWFPQAQMHAAFAG